jgi:hypothetical protein
MAARRSRRQDKRSSKRQLTIHGPDPVLRKRPLHRAGCHPPDKATTLKRPTILFEQRGGPYDDVLVIMRYDSDAVELIRNMPYWARDWDANARCWRIHPGYSANLAAQLRRIGYHVDGLNVDGAA